MCFGPLTEPEIIFFKRFKERWTDLNHRQVEQTQPLLISSSLSLLRAWAAKAHSEFPPSILIHGQIPSFPQPHVHLTVWNRFLAALWESYPRKDCREWIHLAALVVGLDVKVRTNDMHTNAWRTAASTLDGKGHLLNWVMVSIEQCWSELILWLKWVMVFYIQLVVGLDVKVTRQMPGALQRARWIASNMLAAVRQAFVLLAFFVTFTSKPTTSAARCINSLQSFIW